MYNPYSLNPAYPITPTRTKLAGKDLRMQDSSQERWCNSAIWLSGETNMRVDLVAKE